jgi:hypothetical protein
VLWMNNEEMRLSCLLPTHFTFSIPIAHAIACRFLAQ